MNETVKTFTYIGVALVMLIIAVLSRPGERQSDAASAAQKELNAVDDPLTATQLEIVEYDEDTATLRRFEVAKINNRWSIPSHQNYPADAEQQMADAAVSVMNLKNLGVTSANAGDHEIYGVVEPGSDLSAGAEGVGTKVVMGDAQGDSLVNMIVGKEVKDQEGLRYVRMTGKDPVYIVKIDPSKLSTKFEDWIEKDLLKLNTFDVLGVQLNDYSADLRLGPRGFSVAPDKRGEMVLDYDDSKSEWKVAQLRQFDPKQNKFLDMPLAENEELDATKLNDLKSALDDLKIVDVERKPEELSADLKSGDAFDKKQEAFQKAFRNLASRGFIPVPREQGGIEIYSSEGEVICSMKDGVEYVLRFGKIKLGDGAPAASEENDDEQEVSGINRYLFVSARFNEGLLEKPELAQLPEAEPEKDKTDAEPEKKDEKKGKEKEDSKDSAPEAKKEAPKAKQPVDPDVEDGAAQDIETKEEPSDKDETKADDQPEKVETPAKSTDEKDAEKKAPEKSADDKKAEEAKSAEQEKKQQEILRAAIEKENQRAQEEYDEKVTKGKEHAAELNTRFGDWYYVISDEVYKKIHLSRKDIIKKKEPAEGEAKEDEDKGTGINALDALKNQGLKKP